MAKKAIRYLLLPPPHPSPRDTFSPRAKAFMAVQTTYCVPPKLVRLKLASKSQTVGKQYQGWRGVANKGTSPRASGWEAYLPICLNRRSGARHQPLATKRRKRQGCGVVYLHNAPIRTLAIPTSIASGTYRRLVLHLQPHNCEHICACLL